MEAAVFFKLIYRLPAYKGVMRARVQAEQEGSSGRVPAQYDRSSGMANRAAVARAAPPATAGALAALNMQLGGNWFSHKTVPAQAVT